MSDRDERSQRVDGYDEFIERLEMALQSEVGREEFLLYLQGMTPEERAGLLAEADRRDESIEF